MIPVWQEEVDTFEEKTLEGINEDDLHQAFQVLQQIIKKLRLTWRDDHAK